MQSETNTINVVAEIGCNHRGDLETAKEMIRIATRDCGATIVKFQKRSNRVLLTPSQFDAPHPVPENTYGETYGAHREFLEFSAEQHRVLMAECLRNGALYSTSVWDLPSAKAMVAIGPKLLKIPSATNQNFELQAYLCEHFEGEVHVSTGMSTVAEIDALVRFYEGYGRARDLVLYACTSGYPIAADEICLLEIRNLMRRYGPRIKSVGFSGHHLGITADVAALTLGKLLELEGHGVFSHIERHFTLDRHWKGTDHAASLEPADLKALVQNLRDVQRALRCKPQDILPIEQPQLEKLKWRPSLRTSAA